MGEVLVAHAAGGGHEEVQEEVDNLPVGARGLVSIRQYNECVFQ